MWRSFHQEGTSSPKSDKNALGKEHRAWRQKKCFFHVALRAMWSIANRTIHLNVCECPKEKFLNSRTDPLSLPTPLQPLLSSVFKGVRFLLLWKKGGYHFEGKLKGPFHDSNYLRSYSGRGKGDHLWVVKVTLHLRRHCD